MITLQREMHNPGDDGDPQLRFNSNKYRYRRLQNYKQDSIYFTRRPLSSQPAHKIDRTKVADKKKATTTTTNNINFFLFFLANRFLK